MTLVCVCMNRCLSICRRLKTFVYLSFFNIDILLIRPITKSIGKHLIVYMHTINVYKQQQLPQYVILIKSTTKPLFVKIGVEKIIIIDRRSTNETISITNAQRLLITQPAATTASTRAGVATICNPNS